MKFVFLVIVVACLQSSQSQSSNNEKNSQKPENNEFGSDNTPENLRRGDRTRGRYDYEMDLDMDDDYVDRGFPYHEGYMAARAKSTQGFPAGNKGQPAKSKHKEIHILKFPTDPKAVFLYIPYSSNSAVRPSKK